MECSTKSCHNGGPQEKGRYKTSQIKDSAGHVGLTEDQLVSKMARNHQ
jgi:hypothetical protein